MTKTIDYKKEELYKILDNLATYGLGVPEFQTSLT